MVFGCELYREAREATLTKEKHEIELQQLIDMEEKQKELHTQLRSEVLKVKVTMQYLCLCNL